MFESKHRLYDEIIDGWSPWRAIRKLAFYNLADLPLNKMGDERRVNRLVRALSSMISLIYLLVANKKYDYLFLRMSSAYIKVEGVETNTVLDSIIGRCKNHFIIEVVNVASSRISKRKYKYRPNVYRDVITMMGNPSINVSKNREIYKIYNYAHHISYLLSEELGVVISEKHVRNILLRIYSESRIFEKLLRFIKPKIVIAPTAGEYPLIIACKRVGVPYLEIQHGIINKHEPEIIPHQKNSNYKSFMLPDYMALFGDYWKRELEEYALPAERLRAVGKESIDEHRRLERQKSNGPSQYSILVTSQGLDTSNLIDWIQRLVDSVPPDYKVSINIKLHPVFDTHPKRYDQLRKYSNVSVINSDEKPTTYELLASSDFHISIASACHYDSVGLNVPTIILPLNGHEWMVSLVDNKNIYLPSRPEEIWSIIANHQNRPINQHDYFKPNAVSNIKKFIDDIVTKEDR